MRDSLNVDAAEIAKFEALAARWWDPDGEFRPLHEINPLRANWIDEHSPVAGRQLLDVGCGGGILSEAMARRGATVTAIDAGAGALAVARRHRLEAGLEIDYRQSTAEALAERERGRFDIVCCLEMLEHVPDPGAIIRACAALARPGGAVYFSTINRNPKAFLFAVVGAEYVLRLLPPGTHEYAKFIRPCELAAWLREAGLVLEGMSGLSYNPLSKRYRLARDDVSVNYLVRASKPA